MANPTSDDSDLGHENSVQSPEKAVGDFERIQELFWQAVELPADERIQWITGQHLPQDIASRLSAIVIADLRAEADTQQAGSPDASYSEAMHSTFINFPNRGRVRTLPDIPNFEILEELDRGAMGVVYKARQFHPDRFVAIKMMRMGAFASAQDVARFRHEANAVSQLAHAAVVPVYEVGEIHGEPFIVMKYIHGVTLEKLLQRNILTTTESLKKLRVVANAVADAHDHGIIHRDLKPSNILIDDRTGQPWVMDFGLAKNLQADFDLTSAGEIMGTPGYMAPEFATGFASTASPAADVYGLGAILYRILTGRPPIETASRDFVSTIQLIREHDVISPRERDRSIPHDLNAMCVKSLETDPARRYLNAREFACDLRRYLEGESIQARQSGVARRLLRWARLRPGLAVTICMLLVFYSYHLTATAAGMLPGDEGFKRTVNYVVPLALLNAAIWQWWLQRTSGAAWTLYAWSTGEVLLLTAVIFSGDGARSGLTAALCVLVAASSLRCRTALIGYVTILTMFSYGFLWLDSILIRLQPVAPLTAIPMMLALGLIGLVQYIAMNRSSASLEALRGQMPGKNNAWRDRPKDRPC